LTGSPAGGASPEGIGLAAAMVEQAGRANRARSQRSTLASA
jgi:hypothetical protein